jgi:hypothetical protein
MSTVNRGYSGWPNDCPRYREPMLASLLPGLRDLRVPLAAGFMWLVVLWLALYQLIPTPQEADGLTAEVYEVTGVFGTAGLAAALTFVAYLLGILIVMLTDRLVDGVVFSQPTGRTGRVSESTEDQILALAARMEEGHKSEASRQRAFIQSHAARARISDSLKINMLEDIDAQRLVVQIRKEVPLMATRLLHTNRELFDQYDRADAEAKFRFNIVIPIVLIGALIPIRLTAPWWAYPFYILVAVLIATLLIADGVQKTIDSNDAIYQAAFINAVKFPALEVAGDELARARADFEVREAEIEQEVRDRRRSSGERN